MLRFGWVAALVLLPHVAAAQGSVQGLLISITIFFNSTIIPLLFAMVVLWLFYNITWLVVNKSDQTKIDDIRGYLLASIAALVVISSLWGLVNLVVGSIGINNNVPVCPDYIYFC